MFQYTPTTFFSLCPAQAEAYREWRASRGTPTAYFEGVYASRNRPPALFLVEEGGEEAAALERFAPGTPRVRGVRIDWGEATRREAYTLILLYRGAPSAVNLRLPRKQALVALAGDEQPAVVTQALERLLEERGNDVYSTICPSCGHDGITVTEVRLAYIDHGPLFPQVPLLPDGFDFYDHCVALGLGNEKDFSADYELGRCNACGAEMDLTDLLLGD